MTSLHYEPLLRTLSTADLCALTGVLSGGYWLSQVRRTLNLRTIWEREFIRTHVSPFDFQMISGERRKA